MPQDLTRPQSSLLSPLLGIGDKRDDWGRVSRKLTERVFRLLSRQYLHSGKSAGKVVVEIPDDMKSHL